MTSRRRGVRVVVVVAAVAVVVALVAALVPFVAQKRALKDGAEAYLFGYPLVSMLDTYDSVRPDGPPVVNRFVHLRYLPDATTRQVVRANQDTLYSLAWLDVSDGPLLVSVPDMGDRYWLMPLLDTWTDVVAPLGTRATGNDAQRVLVATADWAGTVPEGTTLVRTPTPLVWAVGRIEVDGPRDLAAAARLQDGITVSAVDGTDVGPPAPPVVLGSAPASAREPTRVAVDSMDARTFYSALADGLLTQPIAPVDPAIVETLGRIGITPGEPLDWAALSSSTQRGLAEAVPRVLDGMTDAFVSGTGATDVNGWRVPPMTLGDYGTNYALRAVVAREGLGANLPEDALYASAVRDSDDKALTGAHSYALTVPPPPVRAFWSITVYDADGFLVSSSTENQSVHRRAAGVPENVEIVVSRDRPVGSSAVWLQAPPGPFSLMMRLYWPEQAALDNAWPYPEVRRTG